jgi:adenine-specific DNA-methyltransferase
MMPNYDLFGMQPSLIQSSHLPTTRYQGSKRKVVEHLASIFKSLSFDSALDLYSGSGTVSLLLRMMGKTVSSNDYLLFNRNSAELFLSQTDNVSESMVDLIDQLIYDIDSGHETRIADRYEGVFFKDVENLEIDTFCQNVMHVDRDVARILIYCVGQALLMKRPYNLFHRANLDMRLRDVKRSFGNAKTWETSISNHAKKILKELTKIDFTSLVLGGEAMCKNALDLNGFSSQYDLIYLDPPYVDSKGKAIDYSDFYGFLDCLCDYSLAKNECGSAPHKPIYKMPSGWHSPSSASASIREVIQRWPQSILFFSYRADGEPNPNSLVELFSANGRSAQLYDFGSYKYALAKSSSSKEIAIVSSPLLDSK